MRDGDGGRQLDGDGLGLQFGIKLGQEIVGTLLAVLEGVCSFRSDYGQPKLRIVFFPTLDGREVPANMVARCLPNREVLVIFEPFSFEIFNLLLLGLALSGGFSRHILW